MNLQTIIFNSFIIIVNKVAIVEDKVLIPHPQFYFSFQRLEYLYLKKLDSILNYCSVKMVSFISNFDIEVTENREWHFTKPHFFSLCTNHYQIKQQPNMKTLALPHSGNHNSWKLVSLDQICCLGQLKMLNNKDFKFL